jgi:hypothetical protein
VNLQILNLDLNENQETKQSIINLLPNLQILNGDYITREEEQINNQNNGEQDQNNGQN